MPEIKHTENASRLLGNALECCQSYRHEFIMPEHLLLVMIDDENFKSALNIFYEPQALKQRVEEFLDEIESIPSEFEYEPEVSAQMEQLIERAMDDVHYSSATLLDVPHLVNGMLKLDESWAAFLLKDSLNGKEANFMSQLIGFNEFDKSTQMEREDKTSNADWRKLVTCMNDFCSEHNPLIGREQELRRTIQVLCRCDKNNPLHVGEPGVGKTALVWGLASLIVNDKVPKRLSGSRIYQIDMGSLLAGTQYRGDFENRIKMIMDGIQQECGNNIVYIDEIHTLVGAGSTGEGAMDASNMLKPYLESGTIRFIGSTTYDEFNKHFSRSKGLIRRFQQIDILEPSVEETQNIIRQLRPRYESFHGVSYEDEAISYAVEASAKYINDRFLPDKAIDLIDEAGASMEIDGSSKAIGKAEIAEVLARTCKVSTLAEADEDEYGQLENLSERILTQIYGQDEAVRQVVESVQMSKLVCLTITNHWHPCCSLVLQESARQKWRVCFPKNLE